MSAQFPLVPALPGVPSLARLATAAQVAAGATVAGETQALANQLGLPITVRFGTADPFAGLGLRPLSLQSPSSVSNANSTIPPGVLALYGITNAAGDAVISPDSVVEVDVEADSDINSHPVELGGFSAYNRVQFPANIRLLLSCQGKNQTRQGFLSTLKSLRNGTQTVTVSMPDDSYPNMVLKSYGYKKTAERGAVTIWADTVWKEERSDSVVVSSPPTSQPQGTAVSDLGSLQPGTPTPQQQAAVNSSPFLPTNLPLYYSSTAPPSGDGW